MSSQTVLDHRTMPQFLASLARRPISMLAVVFAAAALVTALFLAVLPAAYQIDESSDYAGFYEPAARGLLAGRWFTSTDGVPLIRFPPGYSVALAALFGLARLLNVSEAGMLWLFTLLSVGLSAVLVFTLARLVWGAKAALIPAVAWMTYPLLLWLTKQANSETLFVLFFYGSLCIFWHALLRRSRAWPALFLAGLLIGFAMLIRPIAIGVGILLGVLLWLTQRDLAPRARLLLATAILLGNLVAILPWQTWVYATTGRVVLLSTAGPYALRDGLTFAINLKGFRQGVAVPADVAAVMTGIRARYKEMESYGGVASVLGEELRAHPVAVAKLFLIKAARSWYGTDSQRFEPVILIVQIPYLLLILWSTWMAWHLGGVARQLALGSWLLVSYFWLMTVFSTTLVRYLVPEMGLLFILFPALLHRTAPQRQAIEGHP